LSAWFDKVQADFYQNFIQDNRWHLMWRGLGVTLRITLGALVIGICIGILISIVRSTYDKTIETTRPGFGKVLLIFFNALCRIYLSVIRGTPVFVQLLIIYFIILASSNNGLLIATLTFGINSGAYVAEIIRGGIMSVDSGQMEAGRSLGFNYIQTMWLIIIPQAIKNVLPALANEFITLLKETAISSYVAVKDLAAAVINIRGITYSAFMPLIALALIYFVIVKFLEWVFGKIERRLRTSEH
jgi:arginine/lysine/histidine transport system permease protein